MYHLTKPQQYIFEIGKTCGRLGLSVDDYKTFRKYGALLHTIYERQCNGYADINGNWDKKAEIKDEEKEARLTKKVCSFAKEKKLKIYIQTDPRGGTIYLSKKAIPVNSYNTNAELIY